MRVSGRSGGRSERKEGRANSSSAVTSPPSPVGPLPRGRIPTTDGFFSPSGRPRADSAPVPKMLEPPGPGTSVITTGRGMGGGVDGTGLLESTLSGSVTSGDIDEETESQASALNTGFLEDDPSPSLAMSARPSDLGAAAGPLGSTLVDEGSDVDDDDEIEDEGDLDDDTRELPDPAQLSNRSSVVHPSEQLVFDTVPLLPRHSVSAPSGLTALLNKHVPHLVSTSAMPDEGDSTASNPFASLYASAAALSSVPSISLELYFPHSDTPTIPLIAKMRKDATVEEVTGYGLYKFWEDKRQPLLSQEESNQRWTTVGWGLRIVEDDGEVDEDFPRESFYPHLPVFHSASCVSALHILLNPLRMRTRPKRAVYLADPFVYRHPLPLPLTRSPVSLARNEYPKGCTELTATSARQGKPYIQVFLWPVRNCRSDRFPR